MNPAKSGEQSDPYLAVPLRLLRIDVVAEFDMYFKSGSMPQPVLYRERNLPFTEEARERLDSNGVETIYVPGDQESAYHRYMERNVGAIMKDNDVRPEEKSAILYSSMMRVVQEVMEAPRAGETVPRSQAIVGSTCDFLYSQPGALGHLLEVMSFDYYTYTHSVNVMVFSTALSQRVMSERGIVQDLSLGALLHDVGKSQLDPSILNCKGKLTDAQFEDMKKHPVFGYEILGESNLLSEGALDVVRHHHEKLTGDGYPDNLEGESVSKAARITAIADIFDALTTRRSYKDALSSFPALRMMKQEMGHQLDPELFGVFVEMMGNPSAGATG
jgi:HD-GYP domain-containing protein (c-di-GMP phosphodiesterase class II)